MCSLSVLDVRAGAIPRSDIPNGQTARRPPHLRVRKGTTVVRTSIMDYGSRPY